MKRLIAAMLTILLMTLTAACSGSSAGPSGADIQSEDTLTIRWACNINKSLIDANESAVAVAINAWINTVEEESGGTLKVQLFPDSQLASGTEAIVGGVQNGAFEVGNLATGNWGDYTTALTYIAVPYLFPTTDALHQVMDGEYGQKMNEKLEQDCNVVYLTTMDVGNRVITNDVHAVHTADDIASLKMRVMSDPIQIAAWNSFGGSVTTISSSDLFSALQQGMVDGQEQPLSYLDTNSFYEVQDYLSVTNHSFTASTMVMNKDFYEKLSDNQKAAVAAANTAATEAGRAILNDNEQALLDKLASDGFEVYYPTPEESQALREAVAPSWEMLRDILGDESYELLMRSVEDAS